MKNTYSFLKFIIFSILTFGIYSIVKCTAIGDDVSRLDGKQTIPAWVVALFLGPITFGIFPLIWWHNICSRIGNLHPSNNFSALTFWGWNIFGILLFGLGPFVFLFKLCDAMNDVNSEHRTGEIVKEETSRNSFLRDLKNSVKEQIEKSQEQSTNQNVNTTVSQDDADNGTVTINVNLEDILANNGNATMQSDDGETTIHINVNISDDDLDTQK